MVSVQESWQGIVDWFEEREPNAVNHLNPGALPHQFKALEAEIPNLPSDSVGEFKISRFS